MAPGLTVVHTKRMQLFSMTPWQAFSAVVVLAASTLASANNEPVQSSDTATQLEAISVTATLSPHDTRTAPASGSIISRKELEIRNADTLQYALSGEPGVAFTRGGGIARKSISLRGMDSKHVLTLIDGRRVPASDDVFGHADYQYGWLPMSAIERIEIVRGPMSTLYGSDALGGVINMITRKPSENWETSLAVKGSTSANSGDTTLGGSSSIYASGQISDNLGLRVFGETLSQAATPNPSNTRESQLEGRQAHQGGLTAFLTLTPEQNLEASYSAGREKRFFDAAAPNTPGKPLTYYENRYTIDRYDADLTWKGDFKTWKGQLRGYRNKIDAANWRSAGSKATAPQSLTDDVLDGNASAHFGRHWLTVGGELRRETLENIDLRDGRQTANHKAVFFQDELELTPELMLTAGLRYDHQEPYGTELSPRVYLVWEATPNVVIKGGYGHGFRTPTLKQSSPSYAGVQLPYTFYGNENIKPEKLDSYELSMDWKWAPIDAQIAVFHSEARNLITNRPIDLRNVFIQQFVNVDKARLTGVEAGFSWKINHNFSWTNNFGWLRTKDLGTGTELEYRPRATINSRIDWHGPAGWSARASMEHTGSQYRNDTGDLPAYTLWGASIAKDFGKHYSLRVGVENLGDLRLAERSPNFRHAERGRTLFANFRASF